MAMYYITANLSEIKKYIKLHFVNFYSQNNI